MLAFRVPHRRHNDESGLNTGLEDTEEEADDHQRWEVLRSSGAGDDGAPAEDVDLPSLLGLLPNRSRGKMYREIFSYRHLLEKKIGRIFSNQDTHVQDRAQPGVVLAFEMCFGLDAHDGGEAKSALI